MNKLNGWQRLWVLFTVLAGAFGAFVIFMDYPDIDYAEATYKESMAAIDKIPKWQQAPIVTESGELIPQPSIAQRKQEAQQQYEKELKRISQSRRSLVVGVVTAWLGWSIGLYVLGWLIAWVIRGFRKPQT